MPQPEKIDVAAELRVLTHQVTRLQHDVHELRDRQSVRRNGHTWKQWLDKWVTPQNILILVMALVQFGGRIQEAQNNIANALQGNSSVMAQIDEISEKLDERGKTLAALQRQQDTLQAKQETFATKDDMVAVRTTLSNTISRQEFYNVISRQVLPRLDRIERKVDAR